MIILIPYFQLFIISFLAATILPLSSELVLSTMLLTDSFDKYLLLVVASFGNILGSSVNWYLGKKILIFKEKKWFPANERQIAKGEIYFKKYGIWSLLLAWVPIIGDPLTVVAGILRVKFFTFLLLVSVVVIVGSIIWQQKIIQSQYSKYAVLFLLAGAIGNFIDRFVLGYVIDFINIHILPVFNFADIFINIAVGLFIVEMVIYERKKDSLQ